MNKKGKVLVVFGEEFPESLQKDQYAEVIMAKDFVEPGSIYEATAFIEELVKIKLPDGTPLPKSFFYKGYELWWIHYNSLFTYFCLPFAQYKNLLNKIKDFETIDLYKSPFKQLFMHFLEAHDCKVNIIADAKPERALPFGVLLQILLNIIFVPVLIVMRPKVLVFAGDKFEKGKDFDFRMRFVYKELRGKGIRFMEFIRSLESWKTVVDHAKERRRPVVYSEAILFVSRFLSYIIRRNRFKYDLSTVSNSEERFKLLVGVHYIKSASVDIWAIRISRLIIRLIGVKAAYFSAALDRNYPAVLGCKLNNIPTVGILHGVASKYYNGYDFLPGFNGEKSLSLDKYGVWSDWWKKYYIKHGNIYKPEQIFVSGPMRPLEEKIVSQAETDSRGKVRILFISEQLAVPQEVLPYLDRLLSEKDLEVNIIFRQFKDGFQEWLMKNRPEIIKNPNLKVVVKSLPEAIRETDIAVGTMSTAVLEMLLQNKTPLFFFTKKWGDYFSLKEYQKDHSFFASNPDELINRIRKAINIEDSDIKDLKERYFGDPYQNGSKWVVDQLEGFLATR